MFVQQKQLSVLNVPLSRVAMLYRSGAEIQLALPGLPSQMGSAFMVLLKGGGKVQVIVALYLLQSRRSIFYISDSGEVRTEQADRELEAGLIFAESMGFILNDSELGRLTPAEQEQYWRSLPICQRSAGPAEVPPSAPVLPTKPQAVSKETKTVQAAKSPPSRPATDRADLAKKRQILKEQLGKFLASL